MTIRSGGSVMVIVNVHFEPDLILRDLPERLRRVSPHWPRYPEAFGVIIGDFHICEPEEGRFSVGNQTFTEGDAGKRPCSVRSSRMSLKSRSTMRTLSRIDRAFVNLPMSETFTFHCYSHVTDNLGERSIPSDHVEVRIVVQKPSIWCDQVKRIPSWVSKHPIFCSNLKKASDAHQYLGESWKRNSP